MWSLGFRASGSGLGLGPRVEALSFVGLGLVRLMRGVSKCCFESGAIRSTLRSMWIPNKKGTMHGHFWDRCFEQLAYV